MRAPVRFIVARHLLTHPEDSPAQLARHSRTWPGSAAQALRRLRDRGIQAEEELLVELRQAPERPAYHDARFHLPNPEIWFRSFGHPYWLSGEDAAARDGYSLIPERHLVYVRKEHREAAVAAALDALGKLASGPAANLLIRVADPWLYLEPEAEMVERGQRLLDYLESRHVQLARGLTRRG